MKSLVHKLESIFSIMYVCVFHGFDSDFRVSNCLMQLQFFFFLGWIKATTTIHDAWYFDVNKLPLFTFPFISLSSWFFWFYSPLFLLSPCSLISLSVEFCHWLPIKLKIGIVKLEIFGSYRGKIQRAHL